MALTSMETKFCKLPLDFGALLSEDVENSRLVSCSEIESIDQFIELLISTAPGEHAFDKEFGCEIFFLDFESIVSHTRWEGQFSEYITMRSIILRSIIPSMMSLSASTVSPGVLPSSSMVMSAYFS